MNISWLSAITGYGVSPRIIGASIMEAFMIVSYTLFLGLFLSVDVYYFHDGITYHEIFREIPGYSQELPIVVLLVSFSAWLLLAVETRYSSIVAATLLLVTTASYLTNYIIPIQILSLVSVPLTFYLVRFGSRIPFVPNFSSIPRLTTNYLSIFTIAFSVSTLAASFFDLDSIKFDILYQVFVLLSSLTPIVVFLVIMSLPLRIILDSFRKGYYSLDKLFKAKPPRKISVERKATVLIAAIILSICLVLIPQASNTEDHIIAVDTQVYLGWISELEQAETLPEYLHLLVETNEGDRPVGIFLIHGISEFFSWLTPSKTIEIGIPIILGPLLVIVTYLLCRELTQDDYVIVFGSLLASVSFHTLVGMYAGFYANWLALIPAYLSLVLLLRFLKTSNRKNLYLFGICLGILIFIHVYTWTIITVFIAIFLLYSLRNRYYRRKLIMMSLLVLSLCVILDVVKSILFGSGYGLEKDLDLAESTGAGISQFNERWGNLVRTIQVHVGGLYSNIILFSLSLVGLLILRKSSPVFAFVTIFVSILILPLFFGNMIIMSRAIYDIPFEIPAAIALSAIYRTRNGMIISLALISAIIAISIMLAQNLI